MHSNRATPHRGTQQLFSARLFTAPLSALLLLSTLWLTACETPTGRIPDNQSAKPSISLNDITTLIDSANQQEPAPKAASLLKAAQQLHSIGEQQWARNLLANIDSQRLSEPAFIDYTLLFSAIAMNDGSYRLAQRLLNSERVEQQWGLLADNKEAALRLQRADLFAIMGDNQASIDERILLEKSQPTFADQDLNREALWQLLMTMDLAQLQQRQTTTTDPMLKGWYQLAAISKNNQSNLQKQQNNIDAWKQQWPQHPAQQDLPSDLQFLQQLIDQQPTQVALLLPASGQLEAAGRAIRNGFFASYYAAKNDGANVPAVLTYDTVHTDINTLYQLAIDDGADMIIGPLSKERVTKLYHRDSFPIPVLALNRLTPETDDNMASASNNIANNAANSMINTQNNLSAGSTHQTKAASTRIGKPNFYQFALGVEDEARQAARLAWLQSHRKALVLSPNTDWGQRSANAFIDELQHLGAEYFQHFSYTGNNDYSSVIQRALSIDDSRARATQIERLLGSNVEFEPRRRHDIDMIFMIAQPTAARQIKPTLDFHYASDIPVYASSHAYNGVVDSKSNRDLNGLIFSSMPWTLSQEHPEKRTIEKIINPAPAYHRLYAMGSDSFKLYPRLTQLQQMTGASLYGATGILSVEPNSHLIKRLQSWAVFSRGEAKALPTVVSGMYME